MSEENTPEYESSASESDGNEPVVHASGYPSVEEVAALLPQFEFHQIIGAGGMGAVYLARQIALDRWVAVKLLHSSLAFDEEEAVRFVQEARSMAKLTHPHIAAIYDFSQTSHGHYYFVMEYVCGLDLHEIIHQNHLTPDIVRRLVGQLCDALQYSHQHGIVHGDIKPANILIAENWEAKIVDFGLARDWNNRFIQDVEYGTPDYVAPERLQPGAQVDHRADIYSLGVVIHEMLTKRTPQNAAAVMNEGLPAEYASVIRRCLSEDPARRFQSCSEIKSFLSAATSAAPAKTAPAAPARPLPQRLQPKIGPKKHTPVLEESSPKPWLWAAACVLLLLAGGWFIQRQRAASTTTAAQPAEKQKTDKTAATEPAKTTSGFTLVKRLKGHTDDVRASAILPDQRRAISAGKDGTIRLWDMEAGTELKSFDSPVGSTSGMELRGSQALIWSTGSKKAAVIDIEKGSTIGLVKTPLETLLRAAWSADGSSVYLLGIATDGGLFQWNPTSQDAPQKIAAWPHAAFHVFTLPAETGGKDAQARLLVTGGTATATSGAANQASRVDAAHAAVLSLPDHRLLSEVTDYRKHQGRLALSPDGQLLVNGQGKLMTHAFPSLQPQLLIDAPGSEMAQIAIWDATGRFVISSHADQHLRLYEADSGTEMAALSADMRITQISVSADNAFILASGHPSVDDTQPKDHKDVLLIKLPDLSQMGSPAAMQSYAKRQLHRLSTIDPELGRLHDGAIKQDSLFHDEPLRAQVRDLVSKYSAALKRSAATAPEQAAMNTEADAIASGAAVPAAQTDARLTGEHSRLRGIFRTQMAQLESKRQTEVQTARDQWQQSIPKLASQRLQKGDKLGQALCEALLASGNSIKPFREVVASVFTKAAPVIVSKPIAVASTQPVAPPPSRPAAPVPEPRMTPPAPAKAGGPKVEFTRGVKVDVTVSRPSKFTNYDDKTQIMKPKVKLTNSTSETYEGYKALLVLIGESASQRGIYKILLRHEFPITLAPKQVLEHEGEQIMTEFDRDASNGFTFGYMYDGWAIQIKGPNGAFIYTKSTSASLEKMPETVGGLQVDLGYDRKWKRVSRLPN